MTFIAFRVAPLSKAKLGFYPVMQASFLGNEEPLADLIFKIIG